jgi:hypothetical protein
MGTPLRKIRVLFQGYKHTSLAFLVVKSRTFDLGSQKVRKGLRERHASSKFIWNSSAYVRMRASRYMWEGPKEKTSVTEKDRQDE